jgi:hypothetical protein
MDAGYHLVDSPVFHADGKKDAMYIAANKL